MKNRYKDIVLKCEEGITFKVEEEEKSIVIKVVLDSSVNYATPPIPEGYGHVRGTWKDGFVIQRYVDGSQFTWVPVGWLIANGTIDGINYTVQFGRRNHNNEKASGERYFEDLEKVKEFAKQCKSVQKYGGFYASTYNISKGKDNKPHSVQYALPWTEVSFKDAKSICEKMEDRPDLKTHLCYGAEIDTIFEWFLETGARTWEEISKDSTQWGNYSNNKETKTAIKLTGSNENWCTNNFYDFSGNVEEYTQEQNEQSRRAIRGGTYNENGEHYPAFTYIFVDPNLVYSNVGFRAALWME